MGGGCFIPFALINLLSLGISGLEIIPQTARHPYCLQYGCKSAHVLLSQDLIFCGGCDNYPTDVAEISGFSDTRTLLKDTLSSGRFLKLEETHHLLQLRPERFGTTAAPPEAGADFGGLTAPPPPPPNTSPLAHDMMQQCAFSKVGESVGLRSAHESSDSRAQIAQVFMIPIENLSGLYKVSLNLESAFGDLRHKYGTIEWSLNRIFKHSDDPEREGGKNYLKRLFSPSSKHFLMMRIPFTKSLSEINESRSPGVSDALPRSVAASSHHSPSLDLLRFDRSRTLPRNPIANMRWWLVCQGLSNQVSSLEKYQSFHQMAIEMKQLIARWRNEALELDPEFASSAVIQKRNLVLSQALHKAISDLRVGGGAGGGTLGSGGRGYASHISDQCLPYGATFLHSLIQMAQASP